MRTAMTVALTLALTALAGCGDDGDPIEPTPHCDFCEQPPTQGKGVLPGVVVDAAVAPILDVTLELDDGRTTTTNEHGAFVFADVAPGQHFVTATKLGYKSIQAAAEVVADVAEPPILKIQLTADPQATPYVVQMAIWDGFAECSFNAVVGFGTGCLVGDFTDDNSRKFDAIDGQPTFLQSELVWEATQQLGTNLCFRTYSSDDIGGDVIAGDICGPTPIVAQTNATILNETGVGTEHGIERLVYVDGFAGGMTPGLAVNQKFQVYTTRFYNIEPNPEWRFVTDGPYKV